MLSRATVIEVLKSEEQRGRGTFDFLELPRLDERIILGSPLGDLDIHILEVRSVEHHPTMSEPDTGPEGDDLRQASGSIFLNAKPVERRAGIDSRPITPALDTGNAVLWVVSL
jgi:hypothetical protein